MSCGRKGRGIHTPEAPVQLHQILAIAVLDIEKGEALEDDTYDRDEETKAGDGQVSEPKSSNLLPVMRRVGLTLRHALLQIIEADRSDSC
jgi:hypothetical protein